MNSSFPRGAAEAASGLIGGNAAPLLAGLWTPPGAGLPRKLPSMTRPLLCDSNHAQGPAASASSFLPDLSSLHQFPHPSLPGKSQ